jgi:integrase
MACPKESVAVPRKPARKRGPKGLPWYRKFNDTWYMPKVGNKANPIVDAKGNPVKGKNNKDLAYTLWSQMLAKSDASTKGLDNPLVLIFDEFLDYTQRHREKETYENYQRVLQSFKDLWPDLTVTELSMRHIEAWFDEHSAWSTTTQRDYQAIIQAALNWAASPKRGKLLPFNPLRGAELPPKKSRGGEASVDEATHQALMARVPWDFKQILLALRHTGTRPGNICRVTATHFDAEGGVWVFDQHTTEPGGKVHKTFKKTRRALIVPLTPTVVALCKKLAELHPTGPLFLTRRGRPWTPNAIVKRFTRWREIMTKEGIEMPERLYAYCYRHQLATDLLEKGESDTQVAALLGHKGTRVLHEHYSGITAKSKAVREMLVRNVAVLPEEVSVGAGKASPAKPSAFANAGLRAASDGRPVAPSAD